MKCDNCPVTVKRSNRIWCRPLELYMANDDECNMTIEKAKKKKDKICDKYRRALEDVEEYRELAMDMAYYLKKREEEND